MCSSGCDEKKKERILMKSDQSLIIYQSGEIELKVSVNNDTVWLRQDEISKLFEKERTVITRHIKNILKDKEVNEKSNVQKMHFANSDKPVKLYSLDIILSVGYRTNSSKAIKFRQWASNVLKNYIFNGYAINNERITHQRFKELENDVIKLQNKVDNKIYLNKECFLPVRYLMLINLYRTYLGVQRNQ
jgi:hypothetical protein